MKTKTPSDASEEKGMDPKIDYDEINRLVTFLEQKNLSYFELEVEGFKIKISRNSSGPTLPKNAAPPVQLNHAQAASAPGTEKTAVPNSLQSEAEPSASDIRFVTSPMVGTFYRAPDPASPPFVEIGDEVKKGQTLCIIEAMKLMNEIESEFEGTIEETFAENGKSVEYGQKLFSIKVYS